MKKLSVVLVNVFISISCLITACNKPHETPPEVDISDLRVDLRPQQTAIRHQGGRGSCTTFSAVAALEAAYKKLGYGDLDLSEEFLGYMGKNLWLHHKKGDLLWDEILAKGPGARENQLGFSGGGNGSGVILAMDEFNMKVPLETDMPYRPSSLAYASNPNWFPPIITRDDTVMDPRYKLQYYVDNFNLDSNNLSHKLLHSDNYYGVEIGKYYLNAVEACNTDRIESILKRRNEVVWDFSGRWRYEDDDGDGRVVWRPCNPGDNGCLVDPAAHSMLIVGFDRTDADPQNHYFIVKNSWGATNRTGDDQGFTHISYDFVQQLGFAMAYIGTPTLEKGPWEEIKKIGRYTLVYDGHQGILDIFHIPGFWPQEQLGVDDHRLGIFFDGEMKPHRVNGSFDGNKIIFYINTTAPNMRWDERSGRKFEYYYSDLGYMAGFHTDPDGKVYGGYARKAGNWPAGTLTPRPYRPESYVHSTWETVIGKRKGTISLDEIAPYNGGGDIPNYYDLLGRYTDASTGAVGRVVFRITQLAYDHFFIQLEAGEEVLSLEGRHLNHRAGNITGHTTGASEVIDPFIMIRK